MKKSEIEQSIKEIHYRLSKLNENIENLENQISSQIHELEDDKNNWFAEVQNLIKTNTQKIEVLEKHLSSLSDELYAYIDNQNRKIIRHIDGSTMDLANRVQVLSDDVYDHISSQLSVRDQQAKQLHTEQEQKDWMLKFGYDSMIADLQLSQVETAVPGNRRRLSELKNTHPVQI